MSKLKPINLDNGVIRIHPLRISDIERENEIIESLFEILSDEENTKFIPEKKSK